MPINGQPRAFGNGWPEYQIEWTDQLAQLEGDREEQEQEAAARGSRSFSEKFKTKGRGRREALRRLAAAAARDPRQAQ
jgi:hypothetical protein